MINRSEALTRGVRVVVESRYVPERSDPAESQWLFSYAVTIFNEGPTTVQLLSRHWIITDGEGRVEHVRGPGVVGEQPRLGPEGSFRYVSYCPLRTDFGTMHGTYQMATPEGEHFDVEVAAFALSQPWAIN